jgi:hypothetical protein
MVRAFHTNPPVQTLRHYPTLVNVDNVPEDACELDEISQRFQRYSWEPRFPSRFHVCIPRYPLSHELFLSEIKLIVFGAFAVQK